jgi:hypothetical protein
MDNALQELLYTLQDEPKPEEVKAQDGRLYVPIGFIEAKLDKIFHGLWKTENVQTTVIGNEVCMTLELHVFFLPHESMGNPYRSRGRNDSAAGRLGCSQQKESPSAAL